MVLGLQSLLTLLAQCNLGFQRIFIEHLLFSRNQLRIEMIICCITFSLYIIHVHDFKNLRYEEKVYKVGVVPCNPTTTSVIPAKSK